MTPNSFGRTGVPQFLRIFLHGLYFYVDWLNPVTANACTTTGRAIASFLETIHNVVYRGCVQVDLGTSILCTSLFLFQSIVTKISKDSLSTSPIIPFGLTPSFRNCILYLTHRDGLLRGSNTYITYVPCKVLNPFTILWTSICHVHTYFTTINSDMLCIRNLVLWITLGSTPREDAKAPRPY